MSTGNPDSEMQVNLMLADYAQVADGKLNVLGAGWSAQLTTLVKPLGVTVHEVITDGQRVASLDRFGAEDAGHEQALAASRFQRSPHATDRA